ncbi:hypothetical protein DFS34DRAFT_646590 [Phlyctochytrium arcticum]|nr:hypothetical protein DFS34DRAFT_646590 [Phlyctochytrium arcticum]
MIHATGTEQINLHIQRPTKIKEARIKSSSSSKSVTKRKRDSSSRPSLASTQSRALSVDDGEPLPSPSVILCDPSVLRSKWPQPWSAGPGLINPHTLCYLNSTLQVLVHTEVLVNACLDRIHGKVCQATGGCLLCLLERHICRTFLGLESGKKGPRVVNPTFLSKNLRAISKTFRLGRQEDSHEFLRCLMDKLQDSCLGGRKGLDERSKATTLIHNIFGGYTRSQIRCSRCSYKSNTYEHMLDLSLDIATTLNKAFAMYSKAEKLEGDNKYRCDRCAMLVDAVKRVTIEVAPEVLTIQLKRFDIFGRGKNCGKVDFPESLDITPSMTSSRSHGKYDLYGIVCHHGKTPNRGHYTSFIKGPTGSWTFFDDDSAIKCKLERVLEEKTEAYMLFYTRHHEPQVVSQPDLERVSSQSRVTADTAAVVRETQSQPVKPVREKVANVCKDSDVHVVPPTTTVSIPEKPPTESKKARKKAKILATAALAAESKVTDPVSRLSPIKSPQPAQPSSPAPRVPQRDRTESIDAFLTPPTSPTLSTKPLANPVHSTLMTEKANVHKLVTPPISPTRTQEVPLTRLVAPNLAGSKLFMMHQPPNPEISTQNLGSSPSHTSKSSTPGQLESTFDTLNDSDMPETVIADTPLLKWTGLDAFLKKIKTFQQQQQKSKAKPATQPSGNRKRRHSKNPDGKSRKKARTRP